MMTTASKVYKIVTTLASALTFCMLTSGGAHAIKMPQPIQIDAGPLGTLDISGGIDGYFYALTGTGSAKYPGLLGTDKAVGAEDFNTQIKIVKPTGLLQFTIDFLPDNYIGLGTKPHGPFVDQLATGPIHAAFLTLAPTKKFSISAGQLYSYAGWEYSADFRNVNPMITDLAYVENTSSRGVSATYSDGPLFTTLIYSDGFDTGVYNFLQTLVSYTFNSNNSVSFFGTTNFGRTSPHADVAGFPGCPFGSCKVSDYGTNFVNSTLLGGYYDLKLGNLNIVPVIQYIYAKTDHKIGLDKFSSNFGVAVFTDYQFGASPWSLGSFVEGFSSNGPDYWYLNPHAAGWGISITPTWQHKNLFVRASSGLLHLTSIGTGVGYGSGQNGRNQLTFILETGLVF